MAGLGLTDFSTDDGPRPRRAGTCRWRATGLGRPATAWRAEGVAARERACVVPDSPVRSALHLVPQRPLGPALGRFEETGVVSACTSDRAASSRVLGFASTLAELPGRRVQSVRRAWAQRGDQDDDAPTVTSFAVYATKLIGRVRPRLLRSAAESPRLKFLLAEGGIGWFPTSGSCWTSVAAAPLLPAHRLRARRATCSRSILGLLHRMGSASRTSHEIGIDRFCVEIDYPHSDSNWPNAARDRRIVPTYLMTRRTGSSSECREFSTSPAPEERPGSPASPAHARQRGFWTAGSGRGAARAALRGLRCLHAPPLAALPVLPRRR